MEKIKETTTNMKKLLVFHPTVAPYRIAFFNDLSKAFQTIIRLSYRNLRSQSFDYEKIEEKFEFTPRYPSKTVKIFGRRFYLGAIRIIREIKPDIIIVSEYGEALWTAIISRAFSRNKYKIIVMCDDSKDYAEQCFGLRKLSRDESLRYIDGIILCNDEAEKWYRAHFNVNTVVFPIIQDDEQYNTEGVNQYNDVISRKNELIVEYKLTDRRVFLFVGRISPEKNIDYLIDSFINQHAEHPENVLILIGGESTNDPELLNELRQKVNDKSAQEYIVFVGRKEGLDLKAWYAAGQILVLPSKAEAFGAVVNEALLSGEYVMVSDKAGAACLVTDKNGWVIDISKQYIDFSEPSRKVELIKDDNSLRNSKMPFAYSAKMDELKRWLESI